MDGSSKRVSSGHSWNCTYSYDENEGTLFISNNYGNASVSCVVGSKELSVGSSVVGMDLPVMKAKNTEDNAKKTIYVPASKVIQNLGYGYDSSATEISVTDNIKLYENSKQTEYENQYSNAINSITYTKNLSGNDIVNITALNDLDENKVKENTDYNSIEYIYADTKNLLGDIDKSFENGVVTEIKIWEEENNTHLKITFDGRYVVSKQILANTFSVILEKGSFSIKALIPDGVDAKKITATDRYWNKQFYIIVPGNHVSFYKNIYQLIIVLLSKKQCK